MPNSISGITIATPSRRKLTLRMVDAEGGLKATSFPIVSTLTDLQLNNLVNFYGFMTNANLYQVLITSEYGADLALPSLANDVPRVSVDDVINVLFKPVSALNSPIRLEIFAPVTAALDGKIVDQNNAELQDLVTAFDSAIAFAGLGYLPSSYGFTERRKRNPRLPPIA
jgi:hypothetical protein